MKNKNIGTFIRTMRKYMVDDASHCTYETYKCVHFCSI